MGRIIRKEEMEIRVKRLTSSDRESAQELFATMSEIFGEDAIRLSDNYVDQLFRRSEFWALGAFVGDVIAGGITAHSLPMTRTETAELFVYDIAVRSQYRRMGVGRLLFDTLRAQAIEAGINDVFVAADDDDTHALDFYRRLGGKASSVTIFDFPSGDGAKRKII
jgi:aminoglycoside 3-N-acetyltransferase I